MRYLGIALMLLVIAPSGEPAQKQPKKKAAARQVLTGCVDEKPESYVLRSDEDPLKEIAQLEPVGFEKAIFARYVGHKVSVTGDLVATTTPPTLRVTSPGNVKEIADICAPPAEKQ
jgi:hypothetical protein